MSSRATLRRLAKPDVNARSVTHVVGLIRYLDAANAALGAPKANGLDQKGWIELAGRVADVGAELSQIINCSDQGPSRWPSKGAESAVKRAKRALNGGKMPRR